MEKQKISFSFYDWWVLAAILACWIRCAVSRSPVWETSCANWDCSSLNNSYGLANSIASPRDKTKILSLSIIVRNLKWILIFLSLININFYLWAIVNTVQLTNLRRIANWISSSVL